MLESDFPHENVFTKLFVQILSSDWKSHKLLVFDIGLLFHCDYIEIVLYALLEVFSAFLKVYKKQFYTMLMQCLYFGAIFSAICRQLNQM